MRQVVQFVIDSLSVGSLYALLSLGIALVFGIMGLINFAHGELIVASGYTLAIVSAGSDVVRILPVILVAVVLALLLERVAFRPFAGRRADTLLVASFAVSFFLQSLAILIFGSLPRSTGVLLGLSAPVEVLGYPVRKLDLVTIAVTAVMLALLVVLLKKTSIGIQMRGVGRELQHGAPPRGARQPRHRLRLRAQRLAGGGGDDHPRRPDRPRRPDDGRRSAARPHSWRRSSAGSAR